MKKVRRIGYEPDFRSPMKNRQNDLATLFRCMGLLLHMSWFPLCRDDLMTNVENISNMMMSECDAINYS